MTLPAFSPAAPTRGKVMPDTQIVSLHTVQGVQLYQFLGNELVDLAWSRDADVTSRCELTVPSTLDYDRLPDIVPWLHWISVWDDTGQELYWTGPIQKTVATRQSMTISARDMSTLFTRTRCPITKRWDVTWPADVAEELIDKMIDLHGLGVKPIKQRIQPGQWDERYDFAVSGDGKMLDAVMDELMRLGLRWTVVSGIPVLNHMPHTPIAALAETDFVGGGLEIVRDGSMTYNDVMLKGADNLAQAAVPMAGLHLQTTVEIDDMFGVSNVDRAVKQYAAYTSRIRDSVVLPDNSVLHPQAPVSLAQLIPSSRVVIDAYGQLMLMEVTGVDVSYNSSTSSVSLRLDSVVTDEPELLALKDKTSISGGSPGAVP